MLNISIAQRNLSALQCRRSDTTFRLEGISPLLPQYILIIIPPFYPLPLHPSLPRSPFALCTEETHSPQPTQTSPQNPPSTTTKTILLESLLIIPFFLLCPRPPDPLPLRPPSTPRSLNPNPKSVSLSHTTPQISMPPTHTTPPPKGKTTTNNPLPKP